MDDFRKRLANLLSIKSIVTLLLTIAYIFLCLHGIVPDQFAMIYTAVIGFYFGTQTQKISDAVSTISGNSKNELK